LPFPFDCFPQRRSSFGVAGLLLLCVPLPFGFEISVPPLPFRFSLLLSHFLLGFLLAVPD